MRTKLLFSFLLCSYISFSQGLNVELGFNYDQEIYPLGVACSNEYTFMVSQEGIINNTGTQLQKIDTFGNVLWKVKINISNNELVNVTKIISTYDLGVIIAGYSASICDVVSDSYWFIQKYNADGILIWQKFFTNEINTASGSEISSLNINKDLELWVNYSIDESESFIYKFDTNGSIKDSFKINQLGILGLSELSNFKFVAFKDNEILGYNSENVIEQSLLFNQEIVNILSNNDSLYVLTKKNIYILNKQLEIIYQKDFSNLENFSAFKLLNQNIYILNSTSSVQTLYLLDNSLEIIQTILIPSEIDRFGVIDFNELHCTLCKNFIATSMNVIQYLDYSMTSSDNATTNTTDISLVDLEVYQTSIELIPTINKYLYTLFVNARVKNNGDKVLESCRINYLQGFAPCENVYRFVHFKNLNVPPGESVLLDLKKFYSDIIDKPEAISVNICAFTSFPNIVTDTIPANDKICQLKTFDFLNTEQADEEEISIYPNPFSDAFFIQNPTLKDCSINIYDSLGNLINEVSLTKSQYTFDLSNQPKGIYFIKIVTKNMEIMKKIIKL